MELPDLYYAIFNEQLIAAIFVVVGAAKLVRNLFGDKAKGWIGVVITVLASLIYGVIQYGFTDHGWWYGLVAGLFAALSFYFSKNVEKTVAASRDITNPNYQFFMNVWKMVRYFITRK